MHIYIYTYIYTYIYSHPLLGTDGEGSFFDRSDLRHSDKKNNISNEFLHREHTNRGSTLIDSPIHAKIRNSINFRDKDIRMKNINGNTSIARITARSKISSRSLIGISGKYNDNENNPDSDLKIDDI
jgi:hypothetical protein